MKRTILAIFTTGLMVSSSALWGMVNDSGTDGCGLGWQVTQEKTMMATSTRGTTNGVVPPTFGMTSGTLGCDAHSLAAKDVPAAKYVVTNFSHLKHEMAMGTGEILVGLSLLMGHSDTECFSQTLKEHFVDIVPSTGTFENHAVEMFKNVQRLTTGKCQA